MGFRVPGADDSMPPVVLSAIAGPAPSVRRTLGGATDVDVPPARHRGGSLLGTSDGGRRGVTIVPREPPSMSRDAPPGQRALHDLLRAGSYTAADLDALAEAHPDDHLPIVTLAVAVRFSEGDVGETTRRQLRRLFDHSADPATHPFFVTHLSDGSHVLIPVAPCASVAMPFSRDAVGLMLADVHHREGSIDLAIDVVARITPGPHTAVVLAALYTDADRSSDVIGLTTDVGNTDDTTALLLTYRGMALSRIGLVNGARAAFNAALARRDHAPRIRHFALRQRAELHAASARYAHARRDLERILTEDPAAEEVTQRLAEIGTP